MYVVMNLKKWDRLPEDVKKVFTEVSNEWIDVHGKTWDDEDNAGREFTLGLGNQIIPLSDSQNREWKSSVQPIIDDFIRASEEKGLDGKAYVNLLKGLIQK